MTGKHTIKQGVHVNTNVRNWTVRITAIYAAAFGIASAATYRSEFAFNAVQGVFYLFAVAIAAATCFWASSRSITHKRFWRLLSIAMMSWFASVTVIFYYMLEMGPRHIPSPNLSDIFAISYVPIIFGIMFSIGKINRPFDAMKKQIIVDISMAGFVTFLLCFELVLLPIWNAGVSGNLLEKLFAVLYPVVDWMILTSLLFASYRLIEKYSETWLIFLLAAFTCSVAADITTFILGYQMSFPFIALSICAAILMTYSAIDEVTESLRGLVQNSTNSPVSNAKISQSLNLWRNMMMPSIIAISVPLIWALALYPKLDVEIAVLAGTSALIAGLMIYRNHLVVSENTVLFLKTLRDSMTGLHNHRYFQEALERMVQRAQKTEKPVSLMLIDIDNFSKFNNKHGHMVGDRVLTIVAETLSTAVRDTDETCRLSGDEFAVILPKTEGHEALKAAEIIFKRLSKRLKDELSGREIGISIGVSSCPSLSSTKDELLATADGALYWVKLDGGDDVLLYDSKIVEVMNAEERSKKMEEVASLDMVRSLARAVDARDPYTRLHSTRVGYLAKKIAERMDMDENTINTVEIAGILHDVGKIGISDAILNKPEKLNLEEITAIKTHPVLSARIIGSTSLKEIIPFVQSHHEHWDGSGYPDGLKGENIPLIARILAVADAFDAMSSDRPYRKSLGIGEALMEIKRCSGTQFDPLIVEHFLAMYGVNNHNILFENERNNDLFQDIAANY